MLSLFRLRKHEPHTVADAFGKTRDGKAARAVSDVGVAEGVRQFGRVRHREVRSVHDKQGTAEDPTARPGHTLFLEVCYLPLPPITD